MGKNIVVVTGSPRKGGNSDTLADAFIKGAAEAGHIIFKYETAFEKILPCTGCDACIRQGGGCVIDDDYKRDFVPRFENADVVVIASPLYWGGVTAQLKLAWDRFHAYTRGKGRERQHIKESVLLVTAHAEAKIINPLTEIYRDCSAFMGWKNRGVIAAGGLLEKDDIKGNDALIKAYELGLLI